MNATSVDVSADCTCYRSLGAVLIACLSTFGLAVAQNWGVTPESSLFVRILTQGFSSVASLLNYSVYYAVRTALRAWELRRAVVSTMPSWKSRTESLRLLTSIMLSCPTFIELPPCRKIEDFKEYIKELCESTTIDAEEIYKTYPLQIFPPMIENAQGGQPCQAVEALPQPARRQERTSHNKELKELVELNLEGKVALIAKRLVPKPEELSSVRLRSGLATLVVGLQASGYLLGIIERLVLHLAISPIEYIVTIVNFQMIIEAVLQQFGSCYHERPLLLHLDSNQFDSWIQNCDKQIKVDMRREETFALGLSIVLSAICLGLTFYYGIHFMMLQHKCILCSICALFFMFALLMDICVTILLHQNWGGDLGYKLVTITSAVLYVTSIIIALIATTKSWDDFRKSKKSLFRWIIPHVAT